VEVKTILIVQNEPLLVEVIKRMLNGRYSILDAASAAEALEVCRQCRNIDLLIADMLLPVISGVELASLLKAWRPRLQILLTADTSYEFWNVQEQAEFDAIRSECVAILEKPFYPDDLRSHVQSLIGPFESIVIGAVRSATASRG
jgi:two-component system, sensor histidine kinase ChiS